MKPRIAAFQELVCLLADEEPVSDHSIETMPRPLTPAELAIIVTDEPSLVADAAASDTFLNRLLFQLMTDEPDNITLRYALIGASFLGCLSVIAARHLLYAVEDECARRAEAARLESPTERQMAAYHAGVPLEGEL
jgi:hypothetical protein